MHKPAQKTIISDDISCMNTFTNDDQPLTIVAVLDKGWKGTKTFSLNLKNKNKNVNFFIIIIAKNSEEFSFNTEVIHEAPNTKSHYYIRSILLDNSKVTYKGLLSIKKTAKSSESYLSHHSLLLSQNAKVETIPSLEIEANDASAGHSASMGKIDDEMMFYLLSRGIDEKTSKDILIKAFLEKDFDKIEDENAKKILDEKIEKILKKTLK
ncbi:MAG: SufD family Fe-S cluster assembly protein [Patescibacteria group bacterium]